MQKSAKRMEWEEKWGEGSGWWWALWGLTWECEKGVRKGAYGEAFVKVLLDFAVLWLRI